MGKLNSWTLRKLRTVSSNRDAWTRGVSGPSGCDIHTTAGPSRPFTVHAFSDADVRSKIDHSVNDAHRASIAINGVAASGELWSAAEQAGFADGDLI